MAIDPFGDMSAMAASRGMQFDYPPIAGVEADLLLVTHEHMDHNGVEAIGGDPAILRSTAGTLESPLGEVIAIASEHDEQAGTERGPNTIFVFELDGLRVCHFGDFGQRALREEQAAAIGAVDLLILPVGGGPDDRRRAGRARSSSAWRRAGWCRCTTARRASAFSRPPTRSSSAPPTSSGSRRARSRRASCRRATARWWWCRRRRRRTRMVPTASCREAYTQDKRERAVK